MNIAKDSAVSIEYTLKNSAGEVLDSSAGEAPLEVLIGNGQIIAGLEKALLGRKAGDSFSVTIAPEDGYGEYNKELEAVVPISHIQTEDDIEVGIHFQVDTPEGAMVCEVQKIEGDQVTLNGNHPLAGETLYFDIKVINVRPATKEELEHGHIHGEDCDH